MFDAEHRFAGIELKDCPTDDAAMTWASEMVTEFFGVEVWEGDRIVGRLPPRAAPSG